MADVVEIWERPTADELYMIAGWRQWADAGSISSGLPRYLIQQFDAAPLGLLHPDPFYLFQIPGTHDLVRPVVRFEEGYPATLETPRNELFYKGDAERGLFFFLGDEPQLNVERYVDAFLGMVEELGIKRIVGLGGVYGELPYQKERLVSSIYSLRPLRAELEQLAVNLSDYEGGASIGSYLCKRASDRGIEYVSFYAFVPTYDFSHISQIGNMVRLENDYMAWLGVMRRINHMLKLNIDLADLEQRSKKLIEVMDDKIAELEQQAPQLGVREYIARLNDEFTEVIFDPLDAMWEEELGHLFEDFDVDDLTPDQ